MRVWIDISNSPQVPFFRPLIALLVPVNALVALAAAERGVAYHGSWRWALLIAGEVAGFQWLILVGDPIVVTWQAAMDHWLLRSPPVPLAVRLVFAAAFAVAVWRAWPDHRPLDIGLAGALATQGGRPLPCRLTEEGITFMERTR